MKFCITFAIAAVLFAVALSDRLFEIKNLCLVEAKLSEADLKKFEADRAGTLPPTENFKCFTKCFLVNKGSIKGDVFDADMAIKNLQALPTLQGREADIVKAVAACKDTTGANLCDKAYNISICIRKQGIDVIV